MFYGREEELEKIQEYIAGPSQKVGRVAPPQPFVLYGAGGAGKSALLSKCVLQSLKVGVLVVALGTPGMAGPLCAPDDGSLLWHNSQLHGTWTSPQVSLPYQYILS